MLKIVVDIKVKNNLDVLFLAKDTQEYKTIYFAAILLSTRVRIDNSYSFNSNLVLYF